VLKGNIAAWFFFRFSGRRLSVCNKISCADQQELHENYITTPYSHMHWTHHVGWQFDA